MKFFIDTANLDQIKQKDTVYWMALLPIQVLWQKKDHRKREYFQAL